MRILRAQPGNSARVVVAQRTFVLRPDPSGQRFEQRLNCAFVTGGEAERIVLRDSVIALAFPNIEYDALAADAPESVSVGGGGTITFPQPRRVARVRIRNALTNDVVEARRRDGDVVTEDAFAHASHGAAGATLNAVDKTMVLRLNRLGAPISLAPGDISEVIVGSAPTNVRLGVSVPALGNEVIFVSPTAGSVFTSPNAVAAVGALFDDLLNAACERLTQSLNGALLPQQIPFALVFSSDTPARLAFTQFQIGYRLQVARFADASPKRVLRFGSGAVQQQGVQIDIPRATALHAVSLTVDGPLEEAATEQDESPSIQASSGAVSGSDGKLGLTLKAGDAMATRLNLKRAQVALACVASVVALGVGGRGRVRLRKELNAEPGDVLAETEFALTTVGQRVAVRAEFSPQVMAVTNYWLELNCDNGPMVWQLEADPEGMVRRRESSGAWQVVNVAKGYRASANLVSAQDVGDETSDRAGAFRGVRVRLGEQRLRGVRVRGGVEFALTGPLAGQLTLPLSSPQQVELQVESSEKSMVTAYPPRVEYDVVGSD